MINFLVCLAGPFQARLRSLACRRPSSRLRRCTAPPGPTGRPLVTLAAPRWPALTSGSRRRPLPPPHKFTPVICWCAPPPELSPLRRSCVEDFAAGCAGPPARGALAGHLAELDASRREADDVDGAMAQPRVSRLPHCVWRVSVGWFVLALQPRMLSPCVLPAGLFCWACCAAGWAGCGAWQPACSVGLLPLDSCRTLDI